MKLRAWSLLGLVFMVIFALLGAQKANGIGVNTTISSTAGGHYGVAYDSAKGEIFVTNVDFSSVSVISDNTSKAIMDIPVGSQPYGLAYDYGKGEIFVANYASDSVSIISDSINIAVANITVGSHPSAVAYDSGKGEIFVANFGSNSVSIISDENNTLLARHSR